MAPAQSQQNGHIPLVDDTAAPVEVVWPVEPRSLSQASIAVERGFLKAALGGGAREQDRFRRNHLP